MKRLLILPMLFALPTFASPRDWAFYPPHIPNIADPGQVNTFCAANVSCTVTAAWTLNNIAGAKLANNVFLQGIKTDGVTAVNVIGVDSSNNTVVQDNAGNGLFFKQSGVGTGAIFAPSSGNFSGNLGWNNMVLNPATFGFNPGANGPAWTASSYQFGQTDATQNSNIFTTTMQIKINGSGTNTGNVEKGGAFFNCLDNDTTATTPVNCVGFDSLAEGPAANSNSAIWGGVMRTQIDSTGDGGSFGLEIDVTNNGTGNSNHGDVAKHKTGLWLAAFGSQPASWMIDSAAGTTAFNNGIAIRNITAAGIGLELPNNIGLYWRNSANTSDLKILNTDASNNVVLNAPSGAGLFLQVNGVGQGTNTGTGWTNMTLVSPTSTGTDNGTETLVNKTLNAPLTSGTGLQIFNTTTSCTTAATAFVTCTTAAISLPVAEADTSYRLVCTPHGPTNFPILVATTISSATQFTITIEATTAAAATFASYDCMAGHN